MTFTGTLNNTTGTISWSLTGPGSVTPTSGSTTSYTPPTTLAASTIATLTASAGAGLNASAAITITPPPAITVSGTVVDSAFKKFPGVSVIIGSQNTVTDTNGQFTIANVTPPYDLTALVTIASGAKSASVYRGLSRVDPTISVQLSTTVTNSTGMVFGSIVGADPLGTSGDLTEVVWGSSQPPMVQSFPVAPSSPPYILELSWPPDVPAITGNVHALQWALDSHGMPASYKGYAVSTGVIVASGGSTNQNLVMSAPSTTTVGGSVILPSGIPAASKAGILVFDDLAEITVADDGVPVLPNSFSYLFPNISGATAAIAAGGATEAGGSPEATGLVSAEISGIALGTTNVALTLPTPISGILPADVATSVGTATDFSWTAVTGGNAVYLFEVTGAPTQVSYFVFTTATTARIPDLTAQGLGLPSGASYQWTVFAVGPHSSLDSAAGAKAYFPTGNARFTALTKPRSFTTQ